MVELSNPIESELERIFNHHQNEIELKKQQEKLKEKQIKERELFGKIIEDEKSANLESLEYIPVLDAIDHLLNKYSDWDEKKL